jgi:FkbH-like protein
MQTNSAPLAMTWLPLPIDWSERLSALGKISSLAVWKELVMLSNTRIDFAETLRLDRALRRRFGDAPPQGLETRPIRLAVLGSSTVEHLFPGLRVGSLRHGLWLDLHSVDYGQYLQSILDPASSLHRFKPDVVLFVFEFSHFFGGEASAIDRAAAEAAIERTIGRLRDLWRKAQDSFGCAILQQTVLPVALPFIGNNEHRVPNAPLRLIRTLNERFRAETEEIGIDLLAIDERVSSDGLGAWHDPVLWHRAKQEITPLAAPLYGELVARILAARQGRSAKCLVLDLDNTLWSGVIGDDGLDGIKLGQGSAIGEAHLAVQRYALDLSRRGIILAVCSKNDEAAALLPFENHPEMLLRRSDIACFVANWNDKATNVRGIAKALNIGLDAMVFLDDNPFERDLVRKELPMVSVPELPDEPALYPLRLAEAGYFEAISITADDTKRTEQYQANVARESLRSGTTDLDSYLRSLEMELQWAPFDRLSLQRIVQLINKTNQFNLTTRRYTEPEVASLLDDTEALTLQLRLVDRLGDNGIIGIVIGRKTSAEEIDLDTWLMSCRVLGRGVEKATLNIVTDEARRLGAKRLRGTYIPTSKNQMVHDHYLNLGFQESTFSQAGVRLWTLELDGFNPRSLWMAIRKTGL